MNMNKVNEESWRRVLTEINDKSAENTEKLCGILIRNKEEHAKPSKVIKPARVPAWSKDMSLEVFEKQIKAWSDINSDIPEYNRYQDLIKGLKLNKEIKGLPCFVNDLVLKLL